MFTCKTHLIFIIVPILHTRRLRHREAKQFTQGDLTRKRAGIESRQRVPNLLFFICLFILWYLRWNPRVLYH